MEIRFNLLVSLSLCISLLPVNAQKSKKSLPQLGINSIKEVIADMTPDEKVWLVIGKARSSSSVKQRQMKLPCRRQSE